MKVVYVAGPFRGQSHYAIHQNICRAEALALEVWRAGAACICPHLNTAHFQDAAPDQVWLDGDIELLKRCDALILTANWERSSGTRKEKEVAESLGLPVFFAIEELTTWLSSQ